MQRVKRKKTCIPIKRIRRIKNIEETFSNEMNRCRDDLYGILMQNCEDLKKNEIVVIRCVKKKSVYTYFYNQESEDIAKAVKFLETKYD